MFTLSSTHKFYLYTEATVMRFIKPLDENLLHQVFKNHQTIITVEDGTIKGGFGSAVLEFSSENKCQNKIKVLGIPDEFIE
jgi:1-deoxy-D-xylulose-5-phosphate synthase